MSKVQLAGNVSGTGVFTIASPNSNVDRTLTLPDNTGTLLSSASTLSPSQLGSQFSVSASAPSNSFVMDASGRTTTPNQPAFYAFNNNSNNQLTGTSGTVQFDSTRFNVGNGYNTANGRFTAPVSGVYWFGYQVQHNAVNANNTVADFFVNGSAYSKTRGELFASATYHILTSSLCVYMNAGDFATVVSNDVHNNYTTFSGYLLG